MNIYRAIAPSEYRRRPNRPSSNDRSANDIADMRVGAKTREELKAKDAFHDASFISELERVSDAKFSGGNKVTFLIHGPDAFEDTPHQSWHPRKK